MLSKFRLRWLLGRPIRLIFQQRTVRIAGEAKLGLRFRPAEAPRLLLGAHTVDADVRREWAALLQPGDSIIDIGAHIGITAQRFYALLGGDCTIWACEPSPRNRELLTENLRAFGGKARVFPYAIGDTDGDARFADNIGHGALSRLDRLRVGNRTNTGYWTEFDAIDVPMRRLDTLLEANPDFKPTFVKVDVEGAAAMVMDGARQLLKDHRPTFYCEYHNQDEKNSMGTVLGAAGYKGVGFDANHNPRWTDVKSAPSYFAHPTVLNLPETS